MDYDKRKANNKAEFERLQGVIRNAPELASAVSASIAGTKLYKDTVPHVSGEKVGKVRVFDDNSFDVARPLVAEGYRVAVLNMASATSPGGGVANGANAQEECLCRESTLYPCLKTDELWQNYYNFHRKREDASYTDAVIYTPCIVILTGERFTVDVVSVAAPNLRERSNNYSSFKRAASLSKMESAKVIRARIAKVLDICHEQGDTAVVLGALGCGAFHNDAALVAAELRSLLYDDGYAKLFDVIDFAVLGRGETGAKNYHEFSAALQPADFGRII